MVRFGSILALGTGLLVNSSVFAGNQMLAKEEVIGDDGYNKTYNDESKSFKDRMKDARAQPDATVKNTFGGWELGLTGDFGPLYDASPQTNSGTAFGLSIEPTYVFQSDSWARYEIGAAVQYHAFSWALSSGGNLTMTPFTFMPEFGLGHSLGGNLFGIARIGFGLASGNLKISNSSSNITTNTGIVLNASYDVATNQPGLQFLGGLGVTHYKYTISGPDSFGNQVSANVNLNHIDIHGGIRFKF